jgi:phosphoglucomutase
MDAVILAKVNNWLTGNYDQETKNEIIRLQKENPAELTDSFYQNLEFGTGGLRGIMGVGTNRINKYTIGMATQGYSNYLLKSFPNIQVKVAVAHDSRNNSRFFSVTSSKVLATALRFFFSSHSGPRPNSVLPSGTWVVRVV